MLIKKQDSSKEGTDNTQNVTKVSKNNIETHQVEIFK